VRIGFDSRIVEGDIWDKATVFMGSSPYHNGFKQLRLGLALRKLDSRIWERARLNK